MKQVKQSELVIRDVGLYVVVGFSCLLIISSLVVKRFIGAQYEAIEISSYLNEITGITGFVVSVVVLLLLRNKRWLQILAALVILVGYNWLQSTYEMVNKQGFIQMEHFQVQTEIDWQEVQSLTYFPITPSKLTSSNVTRMQRLIDPNVRKNDKLRVHLTSSSVDFYYFSTAQFSAIQKFAYVEQDLETLLHEQK